MSYYPYFRGKQYELICIRENATRLAESRSVPIIELVRPEIGSLKRCLEALDDAGAAAFVIYRPGCGPLKGGIPDPIKSLVKDFVRKDEGIDWLHRYESEAQLVSDVRQVGGSSLLHDNSVSVQSIRNVEGSLAARFSRNFFIDGRDSGVVYRRNFKDSQRILLRDGFKKKKNADYVDPAVEAFSDLHLTYEDFSLAGFGDFLTVGDDFSEGGGPAYAVALHISFADPDQDGAIYLHHFVSNSNDNPADPASKFEEALQKLVAETSRVGSKILRTNAVQEFERLQRESHYPGLGYVKKLSMQHHLELMASLT